VYDLTCSQPISAPILQSSLTPPESSNGPECHPPVGISHGPCFVVVPLLWKRTALLTLVRIWALSRARESHPPTSCRTCLHFAGKVRLYSGILAVDRGGEAGGSRRLHTINYGSDGIVHGAYG
jgi:hypothetical protein